MKREYSLYTSEWNDRIGSTWTDAKVCNSLREAKEWAAEELEKDPRLELAELGLHESHSNLTRIVAVVRRKFYGAKEKGVGKS